MGFKLIYVTAVKMSPGGTQHEHIEEVRWLNSSDSKTGNSPVASMVTFIEKPNTVQVQGPPAVNVGVNKTEAGQKYIQTFADKTWTNNLLSPPRYQ